ncbi:U4/U6.U5 tri-snRNP-associated protein 1 [Daktulosphaira vitifoliae]|uniref:U4/U6.U5 tri-snRNP-associated protein 1 n=1 Tax=Daktulosphaira vitifoliae TaxID=58002 RepID=UPI0021AA04E1|nr:U4/U6.U5 tri-snRNP-associated protein 1 [Daktulosphaira vitifoliae]
MGSSKHKKKDKKKRHHSSDSSDSELSSKHKKKRHQSSDSSDNETSGKHKKHKKHHKKKDKSKDKQKYHSSDDDIIFVPPPPKISRDEARTPPPPSLTPPPPPNISSSSDSLSIEETNKLRAKLGLKPLQVDNIGTTKNRDDGLQVIAGDEGEFVHKPAASITERNRIDKIKTKIAERKQKRLIESKMLNVKKLADSDSEEDAVSWVQKTKNIQEEREKAKKKAQELEEMDDVFGVGDLIQESTKNEMSNLYSSKHLKGLEVQHSMDQFLEGKDVILTLQDKDVLAEDPDVLVNVNMIDDENYKLNIDRRKQRSNYSGYDELEEMDVDKPSLVLSKYDEEIDGIQKKSFKLGINNYQAKRETIKEKLKKNLNLDSLSSTQLKLASDYYNDSEMSVKFKKVKKKKLRINPLKADKLERSLRLANKNGAKEDNDDLDEIEDVLNGDLVDVEIKIENDDEDDMGLQLALKKARKLKQLEIIEKKPDVKDLLIKDEYDNNIQGAIILNSTAEFCRTLGDIPTYGKAGNREEEEAEELMDYERNNVKQEHSGSDDSNDGWKEVEMERKLIDMKSIDSKPILEPEPDLGKGVAGALRLAMSKGYIEKEENARPSASRFAHLQAKNYSIEDKAFLAEDEKASRRDRYSGPTVEFREKDGYKPNIKLDYIDDDGHLLSEKEAFRYLSHKFHGKGPGKNKIEKRIKKAEQEALMKKMSSTDTPLGTLNMLQSKQKQTQSPYIVLSGTKSTHQSHGGSISKTKIG